MKKAILFLGVLATIASCGTKSTAESASDSLPTQADVDRVKEKYSGYTLAEMNEGRKLYQNNCNLCHGLKKANSESEAEWEKIVPPMVAKVNEKTGTTTLDAADEQKILRYLVAMSLAGKK